MPFRYAQQLPPNPDCGRAEPAIRRVTLYGHNALKYMKEQNIIGNPSLMHEIMKEAQEDDRLYAQLRATRPKEEAMANMDQHKHTRVLKGREAHDFMKRNYKMISPEQMDRFRQEQKEIDQQNRPSVSLASDVKALSSRMSSLITDKMLSTLYPDIAKGSPPDISSLESEVLKGHIPTPRDDLKRQLEKEYKESSPDGEQTESA